MNNIHSLNNNKREGTKATDVSRFSSIKQPKNALKTKIANIEKIVILD